jgi:hypothetical protein
MLKTTKNIAKKILAKTGLSWLGRERSVGSPVGISVGKVGEGSGKDWKVPAMIEASTRWMGVKGKLAKIRFSRRRRYEDVREKIE